MFREVRDEEDLAVTLGDQRKAMRAGVGGAPFMDEAAGAVVDDDVVGDVRGRRCPIYGRGGRRGRRR